MESGGVVRRKRIVRPRNRRYMDAVLDILEPRMLLSFTYANTDMTGLWSFHGMGATGTVHFDDSGNLDDGSLTDTSDQTVVPSGSYTISSTGVVTIIAGGVTLSGAMNSSRDTIAVTDLSIGGTHGSNTQAVLVRADGTGFTNANAAGTWHLFVNSNDPDSTGQGIAVITGAGSLTGGSLTTRAGTTAVTGGTYAGTDSGLAGITVITGSGTLALSGQLNGRFDTIAASPVDMSQAASASSSLLQVLVRSSGTYAKTDLSHSWAFIGDGFGGTITMAANGSLTGTGVDSNGSAITLTGSYSITSVGAVSATLVVHGGALNGLTLKEKGGMSASRNFVALEPAPFNNGTTDSADSLIMLVDSINHTPTMTTVTPFHTALEGQAFDFTGADLLANTNAADVDGQPLQLTITSLGKGTLTLNGSAVTSLPANIISTDSLTWTPALGTKGDITAFSVNAFDGTAHSGSSVPVVIKTALIPAISLAVTHAKASEVNGTSSGMGLFTLTRSNGILDEDLEVTIQVGGSATDGTDYTAVASDEITFDAGKTTVTFPVNVIHDALAEGTETVTLGVVASDQGKLYSIAAKHSGTLTIADAAPTVSVTAKSAAPIVNGSVSRLGQFTVARKGIDTKVSQTVTFTLSGSAVDRSNFVINSSSVTFDTLSDTGTLTLAPGQTSAVITVNPDTDHAAANATADALIFTIVADAGPSYFIDPLHTAAAGDLTSTFSNTVSKPNASELNGSTSGMGQFTITRKGGDLTRQVTVDFSVDGTAVPEFNYHLLTSGTVTFNGTTGTVTFAPGKTSVNVPFNSINDFEADHPFSQGGPHVLLTIAQDAAHTFLIDPSKTEGDITIKDAATIVSVTATKQASEINGTGSGMGAFTLVRTGGDLKSPLTVHFNLGGTASALTDYHVITGANVTFNATASSGSGTVTFAANKTTAVVSIAPTDDVTVEADDKVELVMQPDTGNTYFIDLALSVADMTIADDTRPVIFGPLTNLTGAVHNTPFQISYSDLVTATNAQVPLGGILTFKVTKILKGTLLENSSVNIVANVTTITSTDSLTWNTTSAGTIKAFNVIALNGTSATPAITVTIQAT